MSFFERFTSSGSKGTNEPLSQEKPDTGLELGALTTDSKVQEVQDTAVIESIADFPQWQELLSGPEATGSMYVPKGVPIACFQTNSQYAVVCFTPLSQQKVQPYISAMNTELSRPRVQIREQLLVTPAVLEELLQAGEGQRKQASSVNLSEMANLYRSWIREAFDLKATDLHIRILGGGRAEVMARIDGALEPLPSVHAGLIGWKALSAMKVAYDFLSERHSNNQGTFSETQSMSCMFDAALGIPGLRVRFTTQRGFHGPKAVSRLLASDLGQQNFTFADMGFAPSQIALFEQAQRMDYGIILQCGVTGSGKTTAAKVFVETHPQNGSNSIYQVADPIEYLMQGVHQIYVQRDLVTLAESGTKDPYSAVIESLMRMDPDIVDVGEIRDIISARAAANVAKSGHMAMGTLHTDSIRGIVNRLTDPKIGLSRLELTASPILGLLAYQALVPLVCTHCAFDEIQVLDYYKDHPRDRSWSHQLIGNLKKLPVAQDQYRFRNPQGCSHCYARGTTGLTIVAEMMVPDDNWLDLSAAGKDRQAWRQYRQEYSNRDLTSDNMHGKTVQEHAIYKAQLGLIDPRQIERFGAINKYELPGQSQKTLWPGRPMSGLGSNAKPFIKPGAANTPGRGSSP